MRRREAYVNCRKYDGTSQSARNLTVKQGGTADLYKFVPDRIFNSVGDFSISGNVGGFFMKVKPTLEEVRKFAAEGIYKVIPVSCEILADVKTFARLEKCFGTYLYA